MEAEFSGITLTAVVRACESVGSASEEELPADMSDAMLYMGRVVARDGKAQFLVPMELAGTLEAHL